MKYRTLALTAIFLLALYTISCKSINKSQKGAAMGTAGGGILGAVIGKASGNTAMGAIIGATVGGVTGGVIGKKMDKQAEEIQKEVPGVKVVRVEEGIVVEFSSKILFGFDRSDLSVRAQKNLDDLVKVVQKYEDTNIEIQGHTDNKGADDYNRSLSEQRAASVAAYLTGKGIGKNRITTKGFGETAPRYSNDSEKSRTENRRVEFLISANEKMKEDARKEADVK